MVYSVATIFRHFFAMFATPGGQAPSPHQNSHGGAIATSRPGVPMAPTDRLVGQSPAIQTLRTQIQHLAAFDGVGKAEVPTVVATGGNRDGQRAGGAGQP